jgi:hypothetical protein
MATAMLYFKSCYVNGRTNEFESVNVFTAKVQYLLQIRMEIKIYFKLQEVESSPSPLDRVTIEEQFEGDRHENF